MNNLLHTKAKEALKRHLEILLSNCKINNGIVCFDESKYEDIDKYIKELKKHKKAWMRDIDLYRLLYEHISEYLSERNEKIRDLSGKLKDIIGEKGSENLCDIIISYLESIPRDYFVFFELPSTNGIGIKEINLTDTISFVEVVDEHDFPEVSIPPMSLLGGNYTLRKGMLYIRIRVDGYADGTLECSAIKKAYSKFKQIFLLAILSGVIRTKCGLLLGITVPQNYVINITEPYTEKYVFTLPKIVADHISKMEINEDILKPTELEVLFETFENKETPTLVDKVKILKKRLQYPIKLLKTSDNDESTEPIKTAIEWAFDSLTNDNDTFAFIQVCIGLESILGDKDSQENITKTLADRCAYLLGNSISKRKDIREKFRGLYDVRSKLVHGRKASLDDEQRGLLKFAKNTLDQIILKEISYIE